MSQYNAAPLSTADNAGWSDLNPELAPFLPTTDQSRGSNSPVTAGAGRPVGRTAALPPNVEFVSLHAKVEFTGSWGLRARVALVCAACSAPFPTNHQLEQHATKNKHKAYLCTCRKDFTKLSALRRHIQESTQAREHRCPLCDHQCKRPGHVEQHLRLIHKKPKDVIKELLSTQKTEHRKGPEQASAASADVPATGSMSVQAYYPVVNPGGPWIGPTTFSATGPADHHISRPGDSSAFFPAPGTAQVAGAPAFTPQNSVMQALGHPPHLAYPAGAVAAQTGFFANPALDVSGYPAALLDGTKEFFNANPVSVSVSPSTGFGMPALETSFMGEFYDFDLNNFGV